MQRISNHKLLNDYISKYNIENIFDKDILKYAHIHFYEKDKYVADKSYVHLNSSFKDIAQFLGTTYRHLSRTFKELESNSIIECDDKIIYILDEDKLRELSKNVYLKLL